ncbi:MAG: ATP-binding protein, partial [Ethanoligenens sp.]
DSMCMAKCFQLLARHSEVPFTAEYLVMDPGYNAINRQRILDNADAMQIPIHLFETQIFDIVAEVDTSPCYLCAKMRRGHLYKQAQELGCNKIALAHHFDDAIETVLMSMLYSGELKTMMPKLHSAHFPGMELIRPMYMVREADIIAWRQYNALSFIQCACRFTENCVLGDNGGGSKRQEMKALVKQFRQTSPVIDTNIFRSMHNVNLDAIIGWRQNGKRHSFLDEYEE